MRAVLEFVSRTKYVGGSPEVPEVIPVSATSAVFWALKSIWDDRVGAPAGPFIQQPEERFSSAAEKAAVWLRQAPIEEFSWMENGLVALDSWQPAGLESDLDPFLVLEGYCRFIRQDPETDWLWLLGVGGDVAEIAEVWGVTPAEVLAGTQATLDRIANNIGWLVWYHNVKVDLIFGGTAGSLLERAAMVGQASKHPIRVGEHRWNKVVKQFISDDPAAVAVAANTGAHSLKVPVWTCPPLVG